MAKSIKELKKENSFLKSKGEKSDVTLIELVDEVSFSCLFMLFFFLILHQSTGEVEPHTQFNTSFPSPSAMPSPLTLGWLWLELKHSYTLYRIFFSHVSFSSTLLLGHFSILCNGQLPLLENVM